MINILYAIFLGTAGILATIIFFLSLRIAYRRRKLPYALIALAIGALTTRSIVGFFVFLEIISFELHHLIEHGLDALIALALFGAILSMGRPRDRKRSEGKR